MKHIQTTSSQVATSFAKTANSDLTDDRKQKTCVQRDVTISIALNKKKIFSSRKIGFPFFATPKRRKSGWDSLEGLVT